MPNRNNRALRGLKRGRLLIASVVDAYGRLPVAEERYAYLRGFKMAMGFATIILLAAITIGVAVMHPSPGSIIAAALMTAAAPAYRPMKRATDTPPWRMTQHQRKSAVLWSSLCFLLFVGWFIALSFAVGRG